MRKTVIRRLKTITGLRATIRALGEDLSRRLAERPAAPESFSYRPVFEHWDRELAAVERQLTTAENAYAGAKFWLGERRKESAGAAAGLSRDQERIERLLRVLLDSKELSLHGIADAVPRGGLELVRRVERTVRLVRDLETRERQPMAGVRFDAGGFVEALEAGKRKLVAASEEADKAGHDGIACQERADHGVADADNVVPWIARGLESLWRLVGEHKTADWVRAR